MIKGVRIAGTGKTLSYLDTLVIPIIENTPHEEDLTESMALVSPYSDAIASTNLTMSLISGYERLS